MTHLANFCNVSNHLQPRNNGQTKQFVCRSRHCKGQGREVGIIVILLKATSFRVVKTSRKVNRTEFPTRKLVAYLRYLRPLPNAALVFQMSGFRSSLPMIINVTVTDEFIVNGVVKNFAFYQ